MSSGYTSSTQVVVGYHGTTTEGAAKILADGFRLSRKSYDWLGAGWYLWQDDEDRAWEWASERHGGQAAVVEAVVDLSNCFDLLRRKYLLALQKHADLVLGHIAPEVLAVMRQTELLHDVDRALIDGFCDSVVIDGHPVFTTVRGCFKEGDPIYDLPVIGSGSLGRLVSALQSKDHVQVAVRSPEAVLEVRLL